MCRFLYIQNAQQLNLRQLKRLSPKELVCSKCSSNTLNSDSDIEEEEEVNNLSESPHFDIIEVHLEKKNDKMVFNPLRFDFNSTTKSIMTL